ncbi:MAG: O-antigen ligase family protein [Myxococcota bacterium]
MKRTRRRARARRWTRWFSVANARSGARLAVVGCAMFLALAMGGAHPWVNGVAAVSLIVVAVVTLLRLPPRYRVSVTSPVTLVVVAYAATAFQLLPLPHGWMAFLSPATASLYASADASPPSWHALTLDVPSSQHELVKLTVLVLGGLLASALFVRRSRVLYIGVTVAGAAVFAVGLVHLLFEVPTPYGVFRSTSPFPTSFINPNHTSAFLGFSSLLGFGLFLSEPKSKRIVWGCLSMLCAVGVALSLSRGGILAFCGACLFTFALLWMQKHLEGTKLLATQLGVAIALMLIAYLSYAELLAEFETLSDVETAKTKLLHALPTLLSDYGVFGVGRGALGAVYPAHQTFIVSKTVTHLENEWVQPLVDWGVIPGAVMIGIVLWIAYLAIRRMSGDPMRITGVGALLFLAVHNLVDFNLAMTGISLPVVMVATTLVANPHRSRQRIPNGRTPPRLSRSQGLILVTTLFVILLAAGPSSVVHHIDRDTEALRELLADDSLVSDDENDASRTRAEIMWRHPSDFVLPLMVGSSMLDSADGASKALRWINRSMVRAPNEPVPHLIAGRVLWSMGAGSQAMLEYRLAEGLSPRFLSIVAEVIRHTRDLKLLETFVGDSVDRRLALARAALREQAPEVALALVRDSGLAEHSERFEIIANAANQQGDFKKAFSAARSMRLAESHRPRGYFLEAQALMRLRREARAIDVLELGIERLGPSVELMRLLMHAFLKQGELASAREIAEDAVWRTSRPHLAGEAHRVLASIYRGEGRDGRALRELELAREKLPNNPSIRVDIAHLLESLGHGEEALDELDRLEEFSPDYAPAQPLRLRIESDLYLSAPTRSSPSQDSASTKSGRRGVGSRPR